MTAACTFARKYGMLLLRVNAPRVVPRMFGVGSKAVLAFASKWLVVNRRPHRPTGTLPLVQSLERLFSCARRAYALSKRQGFALVAPLLIGTSIGHVTVAGTMGFCGIPAARVEKRDCATSDATVTKPHAVLLCYTRFANTTDGSAGVEAIDLNRLTSGMESVAFSQDSPQVLGNA